MFGKLELSAVHSAIAGTVLPPTDIQCANARAWVGIC